jgi:hypothetical protein
MRARTLVVTAVLIAATFAAAVPVSAQAPTGRQSEGPAAYDDALSGRPVGTATPASPGAAANAIPPNGYGTRGDYVHYSGAEISAHGWWVNNSLPAGTLAKVCVKLQVYVGGSFGWVNVTNWSCGTYAPGGGAGKRATARMPCTGSTTWQFRSNVDVDIIGYADPDNTLDTVGQYLTC